MAQKLRQVESPIKPQTSSSEAMPGFVIEGGVIVFITTWMEAGAMRAGALTETGMAPSESEV
jgi:hypothetical protein